MLLVVYFISFFLFYHQTDAVESVTWNEPPPVGMVTDNSVVRTHNVELHEGFTNEKLNWTFSLTQLTLATLTLKFQSDTVATIVPGIKVASVVSAFTPRFNLSWIAESRSTATLVIFNVSTIDEGVFSCELNTVNEIWTRSINVTVVDPPNLTNVSNDATLLEGHKLQLFCIASGRPTPIITWVRVLSDGSESNVLHVNAIWDFINISRTDAGTYRCKADNGVRSPASHVLRVNVEFSSEITLQKKYYVGREKSVSLDCKVEGYPPPTITWTPCNLPGNLQCDRNMLNISKVLRDEIYTCTAKNSLGNDTKNTSLVIGAKVINVTLTITDKACEKNDQSFWKKLQEAIVEIFKANKDFDKVTLRGHSCGSLIVELALQFTSIVSESSVVDTLRTAATNGNFEGFAVNASSIQGIVVIKSTSTPPTGKTTGSPSDDDKLTIILAVVIPIALLAIIAGVVAFYMWKKKKDKVGDKNTQGQQMNQIQGGYGTGNNGYNNTHSSSASPEKTADITYAVVEQGNSMPRTAPKKPLRTYETEILVEGNGSGYEVAGSSSRRPEEPPGKKPKKQKKGQEPDKPVGVVYAQVDKSKQKPKGSQNTYDQAVRPKSKQPGELTYAELDHNQGNSMPRNSAAPTKKPQPYVETEYAMIV